MKMSTSIKTGLSVIECTKVFKNAYKPANHAVFCDHSKAIKTNKPGRMQCVIFICVIQVVENFKEVEPLLSASDPRI